MIQRPLETFIRIDGQDVPLQLFKRWKGADLALTMNFAQEGDAPQPQPGAYTIADLLADDPFYVAHRCGGANWPEFSEAGITGSILRGYKALEFSVYQCASGEFVLSHDWTTERMTGERYEIWETPWSVLSTLTSTAAGTSNPTQPRQSLLNLEQALALAPGYVIFIDHKPTSSNAGNPNDQASMEALLDYMDTVPGGKNRFVWKTFRDGYESADAAGARGYQSWGIYYGDEITATPNHLDSYSILGMTYNAGQEFWDAAEATGKPVIAHIVATISQRNAGLARGADGFMSSSPQLMP